MIKADREFVIFDDNLCKIVRLPLSACYKRTFRYGCYVIQGWQQAVVIRERYACCHFLSSLTHLKNALSY